MVVHGDDTHGSGGERGGGVLLRRQACGRRARRRGGDRFGVSRPQGRYHETSRDGTKKVLSEYFSACFSNRKKNSCVVMATLCDRHFWAHSFVQVRIRFLFLF